MRRYRSWLIFVVAAAALCVVYFLQDLYQIPVGSKEIAIALCAIALLLLVWRPAAKPSPDTRPLLFEKSLSTWKALAIGIVSITFGIVWFFTSLLLEINAYLIVIPFGILFFSGTALVGAWVMQRFFAR